MLLPRLISETVQTCLDRQTSKTSFYSAFIDFHHFAQMSFSVQLYFLKGHTVQKAATLAGQKCAVGGMYREQVKVLGWHVIFSGCVSERVNVRGMEWWLRWLTDWLIKAVMHGCSLSVIWQDLRLLRTRVHYCGRNHVLYLLYLHLFRRLQEHCITRKNEGQRCIKTKYFHQRKSRCGL